jgi:large subunit ribosomal protein L30
MANLNIKLSKSLSGRLAKHIATAHSLGLRKPGDATYSPTTSDPRQDRQDRLSAEGHRGTVRSARNMNLHELSPAPVSVSKASGRAAAPAAARENSRPRPQGPEARSGGGVRIGFEGAPDAPDPPPAEARVPQHLCKTPRN